MEKRALVAMMLILAVLLVYQVFLTPQKPAPGRPAATQTGTQPQGAPPEQTAGQGGGVSGETPGSRQPTAGAASGALSQAAVTATEGPAKEVVVRTPLYTATFSSRGGVVTSFRLNRYPGVDNKPVELVPQAGAGALGLALLTKSGDRIDLTQAEFTASADSVSVASGEQGNLDLVFAATNGMTVRKTCTFSASAYTVTVALDVTGPGSEEVRAIEFGWQAGLQPTEANRVDDFRNFASLTLTGEGLVKTSLARARKNQVPSVGGAIKWSGVRTKYFLAGLVPPEGATVLAKAFPASADAIGMKLEAETAGKPLSFMVYVGPLDYKELKALGHGLEKAVDFGWKWISPLSRLIFAFLVLCYKVIPNYGWVIIVLSALTKLLFHPLTQKSMKSMRQMQKMQPEIQALREKHKKDPQALNKAIMELYRQRGVNPMGGCLPLLLQMPVFIALFNVLQRTIELRRAKFIFWMHDLSAPDVIARLPFSLPFIGSAVSLLPILMGIAMYVQQKMTTTDPKQAMMTYMLPILFTVMFFKFPSGLVLYWLVNNILTIAHQYYLTRADRLEQQQLQAQA
ncbi:MAG TPA: membrane protein insertase YidC [bacterium]|nr:membrane protein insertase YidC [bacterium]